MAMTMERLMEIFRLGEQLQKANELLAALRLSAVPGAQVLTGMPHAPGVKDRVGDLAVEITDMGTKIKVLEERLATVIREAEGFIAEIDDDQTRMVFRLRFIRCLTWKEVAAVIGGGNTEASVKMCYYRYMEKHGDR